jgi:hypothetical protein
MTNGFLAKICYKFQNTNFGTQKNTKLSKIFKNKIKPFDLLPTEKNFERRRRENWNLDGGIDLVDGENTAQLLGKFLNL